jgi:hypothetical protein
VVWPTWRTFQCDVGSVSAGMNSRPDGRWTSMPLAVRWARTVYFRAVVVGLGEGRLEGVAGPHFLAAMAVAVGGDAQDLHAKSIVVDTVRSAPLCWNASVCRPIGSPLR